MAVKTMFFMAKLFGEQMIFTRKSTGGGLFCNPLLFYLTVEISFQKPAYAGLRSLTCF